MRGRHRLRRDRWHLLPPVLVAVLILMALAGAAAGIIK